MSGRGRGGGFVPKKRNVTNKIVIEDSQENLVMIVHKNVEESGDKMKNHEEKKESGEEKQKTEEEQKDKEKPGQQKREQYQPRPHHPFVRKQVICYYCKSEGHVLAECEKRMQAEAKKVAANSVPRVVNYTFRHSKAEQKYQQKAKTGEEEEPLELETYKEDGCVGNGTADSSKKKTPVVVVPMPVPVSAVKAQVQLRSKLLSSSKGAVNTSPLTSPIANNPRSESSEEEENNDDDEDEEDSDKSSEEQSNADDDKCSTTGTATAAAAATVHEDVEAETTAEETITAEEQKQVEKDRREEDEGTGKGAEEEVHQQQQEGTMEEGETNCEKGTDEAKVVVDDQQQQQQQKEEEDQQTVEDEEELETVQVKVDGCVEFDTDSSSYYDCSDSEKDGGSGGGAGRVKRVLEEDEYYGEDGALVDLDALSVVDGEPRTETDNTDMQSGEKQQHNKAGEGVTVEPN